MNVASLSRAGKYAAHLEADTTILTDDSEAMCLDGI